MQEHILHALLLIPRFSGVCTCERQSNRFSGFSTRCDYQKREKPLKRSPRLRSAFTQLKRDVNETSSRLIGILLFLLAVLSSQGMQLKDAVVILSPNISRQEKKAVEMLVEEVEKRTLVRWPQTTTWPDSDHPAIAVGLWSQLKQFAGPYADELIAKEAGPAEGFRLCVRKDKGISNVFVIGNDARGVLFGIGRLLRELQMRKGDIELAADLDLITSPKYPLRGHQLGFRPKTNSYDAWDLPVWEQYIRDLAVFGCNAIELISPRSDDDSNSPHFPRPPMDMMKGMSQLADNYGLDVWVWYPAMDADYSDGRTVDFAIKEWAEVFHALPRIDAVFVPGGDPGHTRPKHLMALLEKQTQNLHRFHPQAQTWVSPQSFTQEWLDEFIQILQKDHPTWLSGIVFGPQVRIRLPKLRALVPTEYPIRNYPDITHSRQCQFPVQDWDVAYAITEGRECINPRPVAEEIIFRQTQTGTIGFLTYSEGCNDDVNKFIWSSLGWDPESKLEAILYQFGRYFINDRSSSAFAEGLLGLERNWQGSLLANYEVEKTFATFQRLEKAASTADLKNWRLQQALFRAYYDAYIRRRLIYETDLESAAMKVLGTSPDRGTLRAMEEAEKLLERAVTQPVEIDLRTRIHELAEALFQSISMQLSVSKYRAISVDRGASLDTLEHPLNNRRWLKERFRQIRALNTEPERLAALNQILHWTDPGPGGFYDDLGNPALQPHLVQGKGFKEDPCAMELPRVNFEEELSTEKPDFFSRIPRRVSWIDHAEVLYDAPMRMHYPTLDPGARYKVRITYAGDTRRKKIRLLANDKLEIHPFLTRPYPIAPLEFEIPRAAVQRGELTLTWFCEPGLGGNGRGCQVSEVWLIRQ